MPPRLRLIASLALAPLLASCASLDQLRYPAAEITGHAVVAECSLSIKHRAANLAAVNGWLSTSGQQARAPSLDCDGDGTPDF